MTKSALTITNLCLAFIAIIPTAIRAEEEKNSVLEEIRWGQHWAGPELAPAELKGKVVLLKIWGGWIGCQRITPGMVSLAKKLKDQPFHLIASYCQRGTKESALAALRANGWDEQALQNVSVSLATMHPDVSAQIKYVPYYLIFDHTGKLRYHHMAGIWHGGDGDTKYQELVQKLLDEMPK